MRHGNLRIGWSSLTRASRRMAGVAGDAGMHLNVCSSQLPLLTPVPALEGLIQT